MADYKKLITRYKQFGGFSLVVEYAKLGVLGTVVEGFFKCLIKRQSFKAIYPEVLKRIEPILIKKYESLMRCKEEDVRGKILEHQRNTIIWFCWLQGIEQAPAIVKVCYRSLKINLHDREIKDIDGVNWKEYTELPDYIIKKWEKGRIPAALFSDLLRLELLIKYGGTWIDSTVLCTGINGSKVQGIKHFLDADLFLFQYTKPGSIPVSISNWFITACSNNEVLIVLREMLYAYWKEFDCTLDYYIFHLFFSMISKEYPEEIVAMPYGQSTNSLMLLHHWGELFNQQKWDRLVANVSFHKLAFRVNKDVTNNKDNYYNYILQEYGGI